MYWLDGATVQYGRALGTGASNEMTLEISVQTYNTQTEYAFHVPGVDDRLSTVDVSPNGTAWIALDIRRQAENTEDGPADWSEE